MLCSMGKRNMARGLVQQAFRDPALPNHTLRAASFPAHTCTPESEASRMAVIRELLPPVTSRWDPRHAVGPAVVSRPPWLAGLASPPAAPDWAKRKLLFTAGHTPKLQISGTRYKIWRQIRNRLDVTTFSQDLQCNIGAKRACRASVPGQHDEARKFYLEHCRADCPSFFSGMRHPAHSCTRHSSTHSSLAELRSSFEHECTQLYSDVNFTDEYLDMKRDTWEMGHHEYLAQMMAHRFCLITPGDAPNTRKVSESVAIGAAGGCVPVFVLADGKDCSLAALARVLPYVAQLDYCRISYVVSLRRAERDMAGVLKWLGGVNRSEWEGKLAALRTVRDAFVFRSNSSLQQPSAAEFLLQELCALVKPTVDVTPAFLRGRTVPCSFR